MPASREADDECGNPRKQRRRKTSRKAGELEWNLAHREAEDIQLARASLAYTGNGVTPRGTRNRDVAQ
jgi:hypothetical protein